MAISFRILSPNTNQRPKLACEITPEGVIAARQQGDAQAVMSFAPLAAGVVRPGLSEANFTDPAMVALALQKALDEVSSREKQLTLVVPDAAVRVLMLEFDTLPAKAQEALPIVRFRLRKLMPFEVDDAAVSYQVMERAQEHGQTHVLVTVMPATVRSEYEGAVRAAGYEPGVVMPSTLASLAALTSNDAALVVNRNGFTLTTAIAAGDELLLHRTQELPADEGQRQEELVQSVSVARAYFEDTLKALPEVVYYVGPGGAQEFAQVLEEGAKDEAEDGVRVRDLVAGPAMGGGRDDAKRPGGRSDGSAGKLMKITINLASQPYVDVRQVLKQLRILMGILVLLAIPLWLLLRGEQHKAQDATARVDAVENHVTKLERQQQSYQVLMRQPQNAAVLTQSDFLNSLFRRKAFSWTATMTDLETVLPAGVQVLSIDPEVAKDGGVTIRLRVSGARDKAVDLVRNLEKSRHFGSPRLAGEALASATANGPNAALQPINSAIDVNFDILADYRPLSETEEQPSKAEPAAEKKTDETAAGEKKSVSPKTPKAAAKKRGAQ